MGERLEIFGSMVVDYVIIRSMLRAVFLEEQLRSAKKEKGVLFSVRI